MDMSEATNTTKLHWHCGFDCYKMHSVAGSRCANVGHFDHVEPCLDDCRELRREKRSGLGI